MEPLHLVIIVLFVVGALVATGPADLVVLGSVGVAAGLLQLLRGSGR